MRWTRLALGSQDCLVASLARLCSRASSEGNNHALRRVLFAAGRRNVHIITTQVEHPAVINPCRFLEGLGVKLTYLRVDGYGRVDPDDVRRALEPSTVLISVMHADNEVGTLQPIAEIARTVRGSGILLHTDATQSVGKIPFGVAELEVDLLSVAGHKLYAPQGVGTLHIDPEVAMSQREPPINEQI